MKLLLMTWPQVDEYLKSKDIAIIPIGSTEQHGPTGLIGTDILTAQAIAEETGRRTDVVVAPPISVGMALHHMAFPGSMSHKPSTLISIVVDHVESLKKHGFRKFLFINGHGGNIPTVTAAFSEIKHDADTTWLDLVNWWRLSEVEAYEQKHFGDQNGFHATVGEVSVTMHLYPEAFKTIPNTQFSIERPKHHWPMAPQEFRDVFYDGRMESNPGLATASHGSELFEIAVNVCSKKIRTWLEAGLHKS